MENLQTEQPKVTTAPENQAPVDVPPAYQQPLQPQQPTSASVMAQTQPENVLAGVVGAFLFALIGGGLYFLIYQIGYIAGICGLVTVVLSMFGYQLFSGRKNSMKGVVTSIIMMVLVILLAEYLCLSMEIHNAYKEYEISFLDALRSTPQFLSEPEILAGVGFDLLIAYALGVLASFGNIRHAMKVSKAQQAAMAQQIPLDYTAVPPEVQAGFPTQLPSQMPIQPAADEQNCPSEQN